MKKMRPKKMRNQKSHQVVSNSDGNILIPVLVILNAEIKYSRPFVIGKGYYRELKNNYFDKIKFNHTVTKSLKNHIPVVTSVVGTELCSLVVMSVVISVVTSKTICCQFICIHTIGKICSKIFQTASDVFLT